VGKAKGKPFGKAKGKRQRAKGNGAAPRYFTTETQRTQREKLPNNPNFI
jgi:hypothetical protein